MLDHGVRNIFDIARKISAYPPSKNFFMVINEKFELFLYF